VHKTKIIKCVDYNVNYDTLKYLHAGIQFEPTGENNSGAVRSNGTHINSYSARITNDLRVRL